MIKIYTVTHREFNKPTDKIYVPIHAGHINALKDYGYPGDDTGGNISSKNCYYGELTALYWIWKNDKDSDYIGLCHYRRYFINSNSELLTESDYGEIFKQYDVIVAASRESGESFFNIYEKAHKINDLKLTEEVLKEKYPEYSQEFDNVVRNGHKIYIGNLFVAKRNYFMEYAEWLFSILFEVEKRIDVSDYDDYHKRVFGFLSEQLLGVWVEYNCKHKCLEYLECDFGLIQEKSETLELKQTLRELFLVGDLKGAISYCENTVKKRPDVLLELSDLSRELEKMYLILRICLQEQEEGVQGIWTISRDINCLIKIEQETEQILQRIWQQSETEQDLQYLQKNRVSWIVVGMIVLMDPAWESNKIEILNQIAMCFFQAGYHADVLPYLNFALGLDPANSLTAKNFYYVLNAYGEYELAEQIFQV